MNTTKPKVNPKNECNWIEERSGKFLCCLKRDRLHSNRILTHNYITDNDDRRISVVCNTFIWEVEELRHKITKLPPSGLYFDVNFSICIFSQDFYHVSPWLSFTVFRELWNQQKWRPVNYQALWIRKRRCHSYIFSSQLTISSWSQSVLISLLYAADAFN